MSGAGRPGSEAVDAGGLTLALVAARWHAEITDSLVERALAAAKACGIDDPLLVRVPGAVELPVVASKTVELFQRYGLFTPLPCTPGEQSVLLRTARCQRIMLPDFGHCVLGLSVYLWLPTDPRQQGRQEDQMRMDVILPWSSRKEPRI